MKRISRIAKGELILVKMISEDLQDKFDKMKEQQEDARRAVEAYREEECDDTAKVGMIAAYGAFKSKHDFWISVHSKYGFWKENVGIRDGYALIKMPQSKNSKGFKKFLDFLREQAEEGDGFQVTGGFGIDD